MSSKLTTHLVTLSCSEASDELLIFRWVTEVGHHIYSEASIVLNTMLDTH